MKITLLVWLILNLFATTFSATQDHLSIDENKFPTSLLVLRVKLISQDKSCDKYAWSKVQILKTYKNDTGVQFGKNLTIAFYCRDAGIPKGESTVYLEKYNPTRNDLWKLLNGTRKDGVSHNSNVSISKISG